MQPFQIILAWKGEGSGAQSKGLYREQVRDGQQNLLKGLLPLAKVTSCRAVK
ncbi:MAG: hypothetical protein K9H65_02980 [Bacteroidales bacterium]|nr:hypothetical protein [Bacteroidales bacterium]